MTINNAINIPITATASTADQQVGTSTSTVVTPSVFTYHLGSSKAWGIIQVGVGPTLLKNLNCSGVVRNGAGDYTVTFINQYVFSSGYCINVTPANSAGNPTSGISGTITAANAQLLIYTIGAAPALTDLPTYLCFSIHGSDA